MYEPDVTSPNGHLQKMLKEACEKITSLVQSFKPVKKCLNLLINFDRLAYTDLKEGKLKSLSNFCIFK